jgi:hypothetical protein
MIDINKEQLKEAIERIRSYAYWAFVGPSAQDAVKNDVLKFNNRTLKVSITENGLYQVELDNGRICIFDAKIVLGPSDPIGSFNNVVCMIKLTNPEGLTKEDAEFCVAIQSKLSAFFYQTIAMKYFYSFSEDQRSNFCGYLEKLIPYPDGPQIQPSVP